MRPLRLAIPLLLAAMAPARAQQPPRTHVEVPTVAPRPETSGPWTAS